MATTDPYTVLTRNDFNLDRVLGPYRLWRPGCGELISERPPAELASDADADRYQLWLKGDFGQELPTSAPPSQPSLSRESSSQSSQCSGEGESLAASASQDVDMYGGAWEESVLRRERDWNSEYQAVLDIKDAAAQGRELVLLVREFESVATRVAQTIVLESPLPEAARRVKEFRAGGCGGSKYVCEGVFFKLSNSSTMYRSIEGANKAASAELRALNAVASCRVTEVRCPLMCVVHFLGFVVIASAVLPLSQDTLVYGSHDGGKTVRATNASMNEKMRLLGQRLNLKPHYVGQGRGARELYTPGDLEGHLGADSRFYVIDTARLMPPTDPAFACGPEADREYAHLFQHLRPEAVGRYRSPLSSDAFTRWGARGAEEHNDGVARATNHLLRHTIPSLALRLVETNPSQVTCAMVTEQCHRFGVNMRFLGVLLFSIPREHEELRRVVMTEMVARLGKTEIRQVLRDLYGCFADYCSLLPTSMQSVIINRAGEQTGGEMVHPQTPFLRLDRIREAVAGYLNRLLGFNAEYWESTLPELARQKYAPNGMPAVEAEVTAAVDPQRLSMPELSERLFAIAGLHLEDESVRVLLQANEKFRAAASSRRDNAGGSQLANVLASQAIALLQSAGRADEEELPVAAPFPPTVVISLLPKVKRMTFVESLEAQALHAQAMAAVGAHGDVLFRRACERFEHATYSCAQDSSLFVIWGRALAERGAFVRGKPGLALLLEAQNRFRQALDLAPGDADALLAMADACFATALLTSETQPWDQRLVTERAQQALLFANEAMDAAPGKAPPLALSARLLLWQAQCLVESDSQRALAIVDSSLSRFAQMQVVLGGKRGRRSSACSGELYADWASALQLQATLLLSPRVGAAVGDATVDEAEIRSQVRSSVDAGKEKLKWAIDLTSHKSLRSELQGRMAALDALAAAPVTVVPRMERRPSTSAGTGAGAGGPPDTAALDERRPSTTSFDSGEVTAEELRELAKRADEEGLSRFERAARARAAGRRPRKASTTPPKGAPPPARSASHRRARSMVNRPKPAAEAAPAPQRRSTTLTPPRGRRRPRVASPTPDLGPVLEAAGEATDSCDLLSEVVGVRDRTNSTETQSSTASSDWPAEDALSQLSSSTPTSTSTPTPTQAASVAGQVQWPEGDALTQALAEEDDVELAQALHQQELARLATADRLVAIGLSAPEPEPWVAYAMDDADDDALAEVLRRSVAEQ